MKAKRTTAVSRFEAALTAEWKRYAARRAGGAETVAAGACFLSTRPCPFEPRDAFETRFTSDCVHCARMQEAVEGLGQSAKEGPGVLPTLGLLIRLLERDAGFDPLLDSSEAQGLDAAGTLLRAVPLLFTSQMPRRTVRLLLAALAGAFGEEVDTALYFEVDGARGVLTLVDSFRRCDHEGAAISPEQFLEPAPVEGTGAFDGSVFERLRDTPLAIEGERDLLTEAVLEGRAALIGRVQREVRLPGIVAEHLPDAAAAVLPVFGRERVRGVLLIASAAGLASVPGRTLELWSTISSIAGTALEGTSAQEEADRSAHALQTLAALAEESARRRSNEPLLEGALRALEPGLRASIGIGWTCGPSAAMAPAGAVGDHGLTERLLIELGESLKRWFEADSSPLMVSAGTTDPRLPGFLPEDWGSAIAAPIHSAGVIHGVLLFVRRVPRGDLAAADSFGHEDAGLLSLACSVAGLDLVRSAQSDAVARLEAHSGELEAQLRHAERRAVVGDRSIQVALDVRNPVAAITGFARRVLRSLPEGDPNREYLEIILRETERLERILSEQVSLAQMTRPRLRLQNLNALVQEVLEAQADELVRRRVRLLKRLVSDAPSLLLDPDKMRQVLHNILLYALHSVPSGGRVRVETRHGSGQVLVEVAHDGPKIPGETLERLFVPFSMTRRYGAGVGLAVAYQIVREHGGEIRARTEGDWSSIVTVHLPVRENHDRRNRADRRNGRGERRQRLP